MKSKNLKLILSTFIVALVLFTSCKNNDAIIDVPNNTTKSAAVEKSMEALKTHFNQDGALNDTNNPIGNILFDFCFEFVYPVTLSYNNGTEVIVQNFNELTEVLVNMTDALFIDGIAFPFDVELVENGAVVTQTINSEDEFRVLLENCSIDGDDPVVCTEEYVPVCVEIQTPNEGGSFIMEFPNMCYAEREGFTQNDLVECDNSNPSNGNYDNCFEFVYPFSIIDDGGDEIVINNKEEFETAMFSNVTFEFVFPLDVTQEINGDVQNTRTITLEKYEDLTNLLASCGENQQDCSDCSTDIDPVCVETQNEGVVEYQNACLALCDGFTPNNFVDCN
ncbi:MAG: hypothetical protein L3J20_04690 [Flavobacteriaceae bacterium]|nr:hypothetical protein [Flavobacteriaceae bacterium]